MNKLTLNQEEVSQINTIRSLLMSGDEESRNLGLSSINAIMLAHDTLGQKLDSLYRINKEGKLGTLWGYIRLAENNKKKEDQRYYWPRPLILFLTDFVECAPGFTSRVYLERKLE